MKKKQDLSYSYYDRSLHKSVTHGNLAVAIENAPEVNGYPSVKANNRKSRRYMDKVVVQILNGSYGQNFTKKGNKPNIK